MAEEKRRKMRHVPKRPLECQLGPVLPHRLLGVAWSLLRYCRRGFFSPGQLDSRSRNGHIMVG